MKWQKSSQALVDLFESVLPGPPAVERKMFGYPAAFVNGNMFMGLFQESMILRLAEKPRDQFMKLHNAKLFEPMPGRPMREYVGVPPALIRDKKALTEWVAQAFAYGVSLKPKPSAAKSRKGRSKPKNPKAR